MFRKSVAELSAALQAREISSEELTRHFLDRIHRQADQLNCMVTVTEERALEQARRRRSAIELRRNRSADRDSHGSQGSVLHQRGEDHLRVPDAGQLHRTLRRDGGTTRAAGRDGHAGEDQHG